MYRRHPIPLHSVAVALVLLTACMPGGSAQQDTPEICTILTGLPFPARRDAIAAEGDPEALIADMRTGCPAVIETLEALETIVAASSRLDDPRRVAESVAGFRCEEEGITVPFENPFDDPVRIVAAGRFLDAAGSTTAADAVVSEPVEPGSSVTLTIPLTAQPDSVDCALEAQPFLVTEAVTERGATDTWDGSLGLARPLPATSGDDWMAILAALVEEETASQSAGESTRTGAFEDVRSKNYARLVASGPGDPAGDYEISAVCRTTTVADGLALVVYEFSTPGVERGLAAGAFTRSPVDGHWRWVHTAVLLDRGDSGCGGLGGFEMV